MNGVEFTGVPEYPDEISYVQAKSRLLVNDGYRAPPPVFS